MKDDLNLTSDPYEIHLLEDLNSFTQIKTKAKMALGTNWRSHYTNESLNVDVAVSSLLKCVKNKVVTLKVASILIVNISTITRRLIEELEKSGIQSIHIYDKSRVFPLGHYNGYPFYNDLFSVSSCYEIIVDTQVESGKTGLSDFQKIAPFIITLYDNEVVTDYLRMLSRHRNDLYRTIQNLNTDERNFVVFVNKKSYFTQIKMSMALKKKGWDSILVTFDADNSDHNCEFFTHVIKSDLLSFIWVLQKIGKVVLHSQGWLFAYHLPVLLDAFVAPNQTHVIEMMDIHSFMFEENYMQQILPLLNSAYGKFTLEMHELQIECENYIVHHADGVLFNGDSGHQNNLYKGKDKTDVKRMVNFASYTCTEFYRKENVSDFHLDSKKQFVYAGTVIPTTKKHPKELFGEGFMIDITQILLSQGFYFDIYNNPLANDPRYYSYNYPELINLSKSFHEFNFLAGKPPWKIIPILQEYQYGVLFFRYENIIIGKKQSAHILPTKLFLYLEAGLPIIVSDRNTCICNLVNKYNIGVIVTDKQIENLSPILNSIDYTQLRNNVQEARNILSMDAHIDRLISLYDIRNPYQYIENSSKHYFE